jgi:endonuclease III
MRRFGVLAKTSRFRRRAVHDGIEQLVPPSRRYAMHVSLVVHGQRTCLPVKPNCSSCPLKKSCSTGRSVS